MSRKKEVVKFYNPYHIGMYVCGPTMYSDIHIGNARPLVIFDVLYRLLQYTHGPWGKVHYVRNITDIDDKIIDAANTSGKTIEEIVEETIKTFNCDMNKLNILKPTIEPRATEYITEMIWMIEILIENKHAYILNGEVLFDISSYKDYGKLSGNKQKQLSNTDNDFILWKPSTKEQPGWNSPWGRGRPGWHIECSTMSTQHLGVTFDIHGGGQDLIFPHHENEIAQSACAHPTANFARYWVHNGYVLADGKKMAKSSNNFYTIQDLLREFSGETIRLLLLKTHYRKPLDFSMNNLEQAYNELKKLYKKYNSIAIKPSHDKIALPPEFLNALNDDLNTPLALSILHKLERTQFIAGARLLGLFPRINNNETTNTNNKNDE